MFTPERMRRVVVVAARPRMRQVVDTLHAAELLHIEDYAGEDGGFRLGSPFPEGPEVAERLLRVKGLQKALGVDGSAGRGAPVADPGAALASLEGDIARAVDERAKAAEERKEAEARVAALRRFAPLGVRLDLLRGYRSLKVYTGGAPRDPSAALAAALTRFDLAVVPEERGVLLALFVHKDETAAALRALEGASFTAVEPPAGDGEPAAALAEAEARLATATTRLAEHEAQVAALRQRHAATLTALDAALTTRSQRATAPVRFRTTANSFVVEGWVPASRANELARRLEQATNGRVYVQTYDAEVAHAAPAHSPPAPKGEVPMEERVASVAQRDGGAPAARPAAEPPVLLKNPRSAKPFEYLLSLHSYPKYGEFDPTALMALVFPLFFGLMVGDVGFGILIVLVGLWLGRKPLLGIGGPAVGRMLVLSGVAAGLFGLFLFGEAFGLHFSSDHEVSWASLLAGIDPTDHHAIEGLDKHLHWGPLQFGYLSKLGDVTTLLLLSVAIALLHLNVGLLIGFVNVLRAHGFRHALTEKLAWVMLEAGVALWVLPYFGLLAPTFVYVGLGLLGFSVMLLVAGHGAIAILELPSLLTNTLSYTRLTAVGMSKAGLALVFNMVAFEMLHGGPAGWAVWVLGILFILPLAILAGGLHSLRLHFVEFFTKFYAGGGRRYAPFGRESSSLSSS